MPTVFISHSSEDRYFTDLLVAILEYHHIKTWYDDTGIRLGDEYKKEISQGLTSADYLIVVLSEHSAKSKWVAREVTVFHEKTDSRIIPIFLAPVSADEVFDGLKEYESIFIYENMLVGFKKLLSFFGKEFLPLVERRKGKDRRDEGTDRRVSSLIRRLRVGMWKYYEAATGRGKFDEFEGTTHQIANIVGLFTRNDSELRRYKFFDKTTGEEREISEGIIEALVYNIRDELLPKKTRLADINVIEQLAEELIARYRVEQLERRDKDRRDTVERHVHK